MDLFHRVQEQEDRELVWIKPFDNRMEEILRLKEKAESAPEQMKKVFLSAWGELAAEVKQHQKTAEAILNSKLPLHVYYNIVLNTELGSAPIDFLLFSDSLVVVLLHRGKDHIEWDRYDTRFARTPSAKGDLAAENAAGILSEIFLSEKILTKRDLFRIVPVLIDEEAEEEPENIHPEGWSVLAPGLHACSHIHPSTLPKWLEVNCEEDIAPYFHAKRLSKIFEVMEEVIE